MSTDAGVEQRVPVFTIEDRLRKARESAGLEQTQLAELIGVSRGTIGNTERGLVKPRLIMLRAWALATGVPVEWIQTGEAPSPGGDGASVEPPAGIEPATYSLRVAQLHPTTCAA